MEDTLVSFEVAKLLKEKGFNESYNYAYVKEKKKPQELINNYNYTYYRNLIKQNPKHLELKEVFISPTQSLVQKWLREVHNIYVTCSPYMDEELDNQTLWENEIVDVKDDWNTFSDYTFYHSYEESLEAGILEALKLIK